MEKNKGEIKNMKKKIGILIGLSLVGLLIITVVTMTLVQVNYKPEMQSPDSIIIHTNSNKSLFASPETSKEVYDKTIEYFEQSFGRSFLSAFFAGQVNDSSKVIETNELQSFPDYKIIFKYDEGQTLNDENEKYNSIIISVTNSSEYQEINIYYNQVASSSYYYLQTTFAKQNELFNYLETLTYHSN